MSATPLALELSSPAFISGSRSSYEVLTASSSPRIHVGTIYAHTDPYPNHHRLARPASGRLTVDLKPYEQNKRLAELAAPGPLFGWGMASPFTVTYAPPLGEDTGVNLSDAEILDLAATELLKRSNALTNHYNRGQIHYEKGTWQVGYIDTSSSDYAFSTFKIINARSIRARGHHLFEARRITGEHARIMAYWDKADPGYFYSHLVVKLEVVWLSAGRPLPAYVTKWITSRISAT